MKCNNTLAVAVNGAGQTVKVLHNTTFDAQAVKQQLDFSVSAWDDFMYRLKALSERRITCKTTEKVPGSVFMDTAKNPGSDPARLNEQAIKESAGFIQRGRSSAQYGQSIGFGLVWEGCADKTAGVGAGVGANCLSENELPFGVCIAKQVHRLHWYYAVELIFCCRSPF